MKILACLRYFAVPLFLSAAYLGLGLSHAQADFVLYDNGVTTIDFPRWSDRANGQEIADDFSLTTDAVVQTIHWSGVYDQNNIVDDTDDNFEILIKIDLDPTGDFNFVTLFSLQTTNANRVDSGQDFGNLDIFDYQVEVSSLGIDLLANQTYWLSIVNETSSPVGEWAWSAQANAGRAAFKNNTTQLDWTTFAGATDFQINGAAVPEPSSFCLLGGLGLLISGTFATRRRELSRK